MSSVQSTRPHRFDWQKSSAQGSQALEEYRESISSLYEVFVEEDSEQTFHNSVECYNFGNAVFGRCSSSPQAVSRSRTATRRDGIDHFHVVAQLTCGYRADYEGKAVACPPGGLRIVDMARPFEAASAAVDTLSIMIPRESLGPLADRNLHGLVLDPQRSSVRLLLSYLNAMWSDAGNLFADEAEAASTAAASLIGGAVGDLMNLDQGANRPAERTLVRLARDFIDAELGNRSLTPDAVGAYLGISRRTLYRLFDELGGVSGFIQGRRLDRAFDMVASSRDNQQTLADIAERAGFTSDAHFSRAFRSRFGMRPGELRLSTGTEAAPSGKAAAEAATLLAWIRGL